VDYKDTNVALIGTDADKAARYAAASHDPSWQNAGKAVGLEIWRVENEAATETKGPVFGVKRWNQPSFYQGDSFIVLHTYKKDPNAAKLDYDVHFWLGKDSSQDERGVAAYKTVELDDLLHQQATQHREKQGHESAMFLSYFPKGFKIQEGGHASGFHHVDQPNYKPRLLEVQGSGRNTRVVPVELKIASLNEEDVFILDLGLKLIQFNGKDAKALAKRKAEEVCADFGHERNGKAHHVIVDSGDSGKDADEFWDRFGGKKPIAAKSSTTSHPGESVHPHADGSALKMYSMSDRKGGKMTITEVATPSKSALNSNDVTIVDNGIELYVWVGKNADAQEKKMCMHFADIFVQEHNRPDSMPVTRVLEGAEPHGFQILVK